MYGSFLLFDADFIHIVAITFTSLILTELLMVALTIRTWHYMMLLMEIFSLFWYALALIVFKDSFGKHFTSTFPLFEFVISLILLDPLSLLSCTLPYFLITFSSKVLFKFNLKNLPTINCCLKFQNKIFLICKTTL